MENDLYVEKGSPNKERDRVKKLLNLFAGHDLKFDRDTRIRRAGTPVALFQDTDLPSPVATKTSKNTSLLAVCPNVFDPNCTKSTPITEDDEAYTFKKSKFGVHDYLQEFHQVREADKAKKAKLHAEMKLGTHR